MAPSGAPLRAWRCVACAAAAGGADGGEGGAAAGDDEEEEPRLKQLVDDVRLCVNDLYLCYKELQASTRGDATHARPARAHRTRINGTGHRPTSAQHGAL